MDDQPLKQVQELDGEEHHEQLVKTCTVLQYSGGHSVVDDVKQQALCAEIKD